LLVPAESEQDFRQHRPDQGRAVVVQQLVQRPFLAALRTIEERAPDAGIDQNQLSDCHVVLSIRTSSFQTPIGFRCPDEGLDIRAMVVIEVDLERHQWIS